MAFGSRVARHPGGTLILLDHDVDDAGIELIKDGNQRFCSDIPQLHRPLLDVVYPSSPPLDHFYPSRKTNAHPSTMLLSLPYDNSRASHIIALPTNHSIPPRMVDLPESLPTFSGAGS